MPVSEGVNKDVDVVFNLVVNLTTKLNTLVLGTYLGKKNFKEPYTVLLMEELL